MSAFSRICEIGLSALPLKFRGALRSAASRIADSAIATGAITVDARGAGGSGGNSTSVGARTSPRGATKSKTFRLTTNETTMTATAIAIVFRCIGRRIVSPDQEIAPRALFTGKGTGAPVRGRSSLSPADAVADRRSRDDHINLSRRFDVTNQRTSRATTQAASSSCPLRAIVRKAAVEAFPCRSCVPRRGPSDVPIERAALEAWAGRRGQADGPASSSD